MTKRDPQVESRLAELRARLEVVAHDIRAKQDELVPMVEEKHRIITEINQLDQPEVP